MKSGCLLLLASFISLSESSINCNVADISCGFGVCVARKTDGSAYAWGESTRGGDATGVDLTSDVADISCGNYACVARKTDGSAYAWGDSSKGGDASGVDLTSDVADISCSSYACVARKTDGSAYAWGSSSYGGDASGVDLTSDVADISCGSYACVARKTDGSAYAWGFSPKGGDASGVNLTSGVADISCANSVCVARKTDGSAYAWGFSTRGGDASSLPNTCWTDPCIAKAGSGRLRRKRQKCRARERGGRRSRCHWDSVNRVCHIKAWLHPDRAPPECTGGCCGYNKRKCGFKKNCYFQRDPTRTFITPDGKFYGYCKNK